MSDEPEIATLHRQIQASPALQKAFEQSCWWYSLYARSQLKRSGYLSPTVAAPAMAHCPWVRIWSNPCFMWETEIAAMTLTVFYGGEETATCRRAIWKQSDLKQRMLKIIESGGATILPDPDISLEDAQLSVAQLQDYLRAIAACIVPAICLQNPKNSCVTCDVGSFRFEYFSPDQPPASIKYDWSDRIPLEWKPVIEQITRLQDFLRNLFK